MSRAKPMDLDAALATMSADGLEANQAGTYLATFRAVAKKLY